MGDGDLCWFIDGFLINYTTQAYTLYGVSYSIMTYFLKGTFQIVLSVFSCINLVLSRFLIDTFGKTLISH